MTEARYGDKSAVLTAEPGDVIEFENQGQRFGGTVWESPTTGALCAGDTFIRLRGEWIATMEHVVAVRRKHDKEPESLAARYKRLVDTSDDIPRSLLRAYIDRIQERLKP